VGNAHEVGVDRLKLVLRIGVARQKLDRTGWVPAAGVGHRTQGRKAIGDLGVSRQEFRDSHTGRSCLDWFDRPAIFGRDVWLRIVGVEVTAAAAQPDENGLPIVPSYLPARPRHEVGSALATTARRMLKGETAETLVANRASNSRGSGSNQSILDKQARHPGWTFAAIVSRAASGFRINCRSGPNLPCQLEQIQGSLEDRPLVPLGDALQLSVQVHRAMFQNLGLLGKPWAVRHG
jgi:hypothetical protein